jgi:hypothetical protein
MRIRDPGWKKFGSGIRDKKNSDPWYPYLIFLLGLGRTRSDFGGRTVFHNIAKGKSINGVDRLAWHSPASPR